MKASVRRRGVPSKKKTLKGSFLVEAIIGIGVFAIIASTIAVSLLMQIGSSASLRDTALATALAEEGLEAARSIRDSSWDGLTVGTHGLTWSSGAWSFSNTSDTTNGFTRTITVTDAGLHARQIDAQINWSPNPSHPRSLSLSTVLSDWRNAEQTPIGGGGGGMSGDWHYPTIIVGPTIPNFRGTSVDVASTTVALGGYGTMSSVKDLYLLDITNPFTPTVISGINTGNGVYRVKMDFARKYVYMANAASTNQLQIVNISNPSSLTLTKQFTVGAATGKSIDSVGTTVYFGTNRSSSANEFFVVDVSNVSSPVIKGSLEVGDDVNDIHVVGKYAYLATASDNKEVMIVDITTSTSPRLVSTVNIVGSNDALSIFYDATTSRIYLGREDDWFGSHVVGAIIDATDKANPTILGTLDTEDGMNMTSVYGIGHAWFVGFQFFLDMRVYDATNPADIRYYGGSQFGFCRTPTDMEFQDNFLFMSIYQSDTLRIATGM